MCRKFRLGEAGLRSRGKTTRQPYCKIKSDEESRRAVCIVFRGISGFELTLCRERFLKYSINTIRSKYGGDGLCN